MSWTYRVMRRESDGLVVYGVYEFYAPREGESQGVGLKKRSNVAVR